jgi:hypothetical protein
MKETPQNEQGLFLNGEPYRAEDKRNPRNAGHWRRRIVVCILLIEVCLVVPIRSSSASRSSASRSGRGVRSMDAVCHHFTKTHPWKTRINTGES